MQVKKAIITAAGDGTTAGGRTLQLPLQSVVDRGGHVRTALELLVDEVVAAGIEEIGLVVKPGQSDAYRQAAGTQAKVTCVEQHNPRGYGDALLRCREFAADEPFLHLVSDHLYVSRAKQSCAAQLIEVANQEGCAVSAVQPTRENQLAFFGAVGGSPVPRQPGRFEISVVVEKPTPTQAEQSLVVAGQRSGHYLCLFGMHVLTPGIFDLLASELEQAESGQAINLSAALNQLAQSQRYLAAELNGLRYDIGEKYGLLIAQLAIALSGDDRDRILTELVELVAGR